MHASSIQRDARRSAARNARLMHHERNPQSMLDRVLASMPSGDLWVFGYGSLLWNPEVAHTEAHPARVWGYRRGLCMWSRINRGTDQEPGLVFALTAGGSCQGIALRVPRVRAEDELRLLWKREMPRATYDPRWLRCHTGEGVVHALAFTLPQDSPSYTGTLDDTQLVQILRHRRGRFGTTLEYVLRTAYALEEAGICDREVRRIVALADAHGLR